MGRVRAEAGAGTEALLAGAGRSQSCISCKLLRSPFSVFPWRSLESLAVFSCVSVVSPPWPATLQGRRFANLPFFLLN